MHDNDRMGPWAEAFYKVMATEAAIELGQRLGDEIPLDESLTAIDARMLGMAGGVAAMRVARQAGIGRFEQHLVAVVSGTATARHAKRLRLARSGE